MFGTHSTEMFEMWRGMPDQIQYLLDHIGTPTNALKLNLSHTNL